MNINIEEETEKANKSVEKALASLRGYIAALPSLAAALNATELQYCYLYPEENKIICRARTRADFAPIRALRHGLWEKNVSEDDGILTMRYWGYTDMGTEVVCFVCELPPSCRIEETKVEVEAHTRIERKVICTETRELATAQR